MTSEEMSTIWVPTCCGLAMRHNIFREREGPGHGTLVCSNCSKHISLEPEPLSALTEFGEGAKLLNVVAAPRPPKAARRTPAGARREIDDQTL